MGTVKTDRCSQKSLKQIQKEFTPWHVATEVVNADIIAPDDENVAASLMFRSRW